MSRLRVMSSRGALSAAETSSVTSVPKSTMIARGLDIPEARFSARAVARSSNISSIDPRKAVAPTATRTAASTNMAATTDRPIRPILSESFIYISNYKIYCNFVKGSPPASQECRG